MLKVVVILILLSISSLWAKNVEIDVFGLTCPFCVDSLTRKFKKMDDVKSVVVSLKLKKVRLETKSDKPDLKALKQAVIDAGFTPVKIVAK